MKPTFNQHNDFLAHNTIGGLHFEHNDYVKIVTGEDKGQTGSLISVEELSEDPVYVLELESGSDIRIKQSQIEFG